jgi:dolichol-phosphate mannosyltransferase
MFLSIVIALYNEEGNVRKLTDRIYSSVKVPFELIYVIDGDDNSYSILKEISKTKKNLKIDYSVKKRGYKNSFIKGFSLVDKKVTHILTMDGDLNHRPEEIIKLIRRMESINSDLVIGSRYVRNARVENIALWKKGISIFANLVIKFFWNLKISDQTSGFRLYKRKVIEKVVGKCRSENFEFLLELLIIAKKLGFSFSEVPIKFQARITGKSKFEIFRSIGGYKRLVSLYWRNN